MANGTFWVITGEGITEIGISPTALSGLAALGLVVVVANVSLDYNMKVAASDLTIAEKLLRMGYSPEAVSLYMIKRGSMTAGEIIEKEKKGSINREFPNKWRDKKYDEIAAEAKKGDKSAQKAKKLLDDGRFDK